MTSAELCRKKGWGPGDVFADSDDLDQKPYLLVTAVGFEGVLGVSLGEHRKNSRGEPFWRACEGEERWVDLADPDFVYVHLGRVGGGPPVPLLRRFQRRELRCHECKESFRLVEPYGAEDDADLFLVHHFCAFCGKWTLRDFWIDRGDPSPGFFAPVTEEADGVRPTETV
jgi:hypothetical protein